MKQKLGYLIPTTTDVQLGLEVIPYYSGINEGSKLRLSLENMTCDISDIEDDKHIAVAYLNKKQVLSVVGNILKFLEGRVIKKGFCITNPNGNLFVDKSTIKETGKVEFFIMLNRGGSSEQWTSLTKDGATLLASVLLETSLDLDDD